MRALIAFFFFAIASSSQLLRDQKDAMLNFNNLRHHRLDLSTTNKPESHKGQNATIKLFPAFDVSSKPIMAFSGQESRSLTIDLAPEVCLSGQYYLNNLLITDLPECLDGTTPALSYYENTECVGIPKLSVDHPFSTCLWNGHTSKSWSLIFRCGANPRKAQGAYHHQTATPPKGLQTLKRVVNGVVISNFFPSCEAHWSDPAIEVAVDRCFGTPGYGLRITVPAVCANGTRAKWARFEDAKCNNGVLSDRYGLKEILDSDIGSCFSVEEGANKERKGSYAFWCDGLHQETTQTRSFNEMDEAALEFLQSDQPCEDNQSSLTDSSRDHIQALQISFTRFPAWLWIYICSLLLLLALSFVIYIVGVRMKRSRRQRYGLIRL